MPAPMAGRDPLRRLTQVQYRNSVRDLLGVDAADVALPSDGQVGAFTSNGELAIGLLQLDQYAAAAELVAGRAAARLDDLSGCRPAPGAEEACAKALIEALGPRAYRRPLTDADRSASLKVYAAGRAGRDHRGATTLVIEALLQAPDFLYLVERGRPDGAGQRKLDGHEIAARLSYLLWDTLPDPALVTAAAGGELDGADGVARHAARLLADGRARQALVRFHREWLRLGGLSTLSKDPARYPFFDESVKAALGAETDAFVDFVVRQSDGRVATLLAAPFSFLTKPLFRIYGMVEPAGHDPARPIGLSPAQRAGILTQPAVLATHAHADITSPVHRGLFLYSSVLCRDLPPPPPNVDTTPIRPDPTSMKTRRARFVEHQANAACAGCHKLIDPLGFAFERYDAMGAYREMDVDERAPVDASAEIALGSDIDGPVPHALPLIAKLAHSADVRACYARQWFRYARGRHEIPEDDPELRALEQGLHAAQGDVRAVLHALVTSDSFRFRREPVGGQP